MKQIMNKIVKNNKLTLKLKKVKAGLLKNNFNKKINCN